MGLLPVFRIEMPTPYPVGPVNAYLIDARPLTLVDAGVNTPEGRRAFYDALSSHGVEVEAIEQVLVTHAHPDHYGLAQELHETSGANVFFPEREIARVGDRDMLLATGRLLLEAGMPFELLVRMDEHRKRGPRPHLDHSHVVPVRDRDTFRLQTNERTVELQARLMPGHTGGHVVYLDDWTKTLFAGDQLLPTVSPNPLLEPSVDEPDRRRASLKEYLRSLATMAGMNLHVAYPGHGDAITDPRAVIDDTLEHHRKRKTEVASHLGRDPKTPYELALEIFPEATGYDAFLAVSEVLAHLDLVVDDGEALVERRDDVTYYRAAGDPAAKE